MINKNKFFLLGLLLIICLTIPITFAEENISNSLTIDVDDSNEEVVSLIDNNISISENNLECETDQPVTDDVLASSVAVNGDVETQSGGKTFKKEYFGQEITVYLSPEDIASLKKGIGFESYTSEIVKVQTYKKLFKTVKKPVKKTVFVAKINKYTGKVKWSSKYFKKTIKYATKYKYKGTYEKIKGRYIYIYQKYKGYKKVKKAYYKTVWVKKELIVKAFKISQNCEYPKGYYLSLGFNGADREGWWDYKIQI